MYTAHFGLGDNPFSITPDPRYLYLSPHHQEALAHLLYGIGENGGFLQLTGEVGTGKTTLIRTLLEQQMDNVDVALCLNPRLTVEELVATICDELHADYPRDSRTLKPLLDALNKHLLATHARGRRTVLIIDEAQSLSREVLEQVRLLTNLETHRHKLLRIILVGQPELQQVLGRQDLRQLAQRITARYHLAPLSRGETAAYVTHRLSVAGGRADLFTGAALRAVHRLTRGVPRLINIVCDRALMGAYARGLYRVSATTVRRAAREALGPRRGTAGNLGRWLALGSVPVSVIAAALGLQLLHSAPMPADTAASRSEDGPAAVALTSLAADSLPAPAAEDASRPAPPIPAEDTPPVAPLQPEATPDLAELLFDSEGPDDSLARLLRAWGEDMRFTSGVAPCEQVKTLGLRCLYGHGDWAELRRHNRPAILTLAAADGHRRQVLLRELAAESATLDTGERPVEAGLAALAPLWTGDYLLLWRLETAQPLIGPGSRGEPVLWLRQRLALAQGLDPSASAARPAEFDPALQDEVRQFQRAHNLVPDGIVGERTMPLLDTLAPAPGTPLLTPVPAPEVQ